MGNLVDLVQQIQLHSFSFSSKRNLLFLKTVKYRMATTTADFVRTFGRRGNSPICHRLTDFFPKEPTAISVVGNTPEPEP